MKENESPFPSAGGWKRYVIHQKLHLLNLEIGPFSNPSVIYFKVGFWLLFKSLQSPWESESSCSPFCQYTSICRQTLNERHEESPNDLAGR